MRLHQVYEAVDALAPFRLSREFIERYAARDNSGLLFDGGEDVRGVLVSLDLSSRTVAAAKEAGANCIVTHHPAIWDGLMRLTEDGDSALLACIRAGISVISAHLNLDAAEGGIDDCLMQGLGGSAPVSVMQPLTGGGYGKLFDVPKKPFEVFCGEVSSTFHTGRLLSYGKGEVGRIASFCGAGLDGEAIDFAASNGADTIVSSDVRHHTLLAALERGLKVVLLTHYASETYGMRRFFERLETALSVRVSFFEDATML